MPKSHNLTIRTRFREHRCGSALSARRQGPSAARAYDRGRGTRRINPPITTGGSRHEDLREENWTPNGGCARRVRAVAASTVVVPAVSGAGAPAPAAAPTADDAAVLNQWNLIAQTEGVLIRPTAHGQARGMAMVQGAVYDAVNAIDRGYQPYLLDVEALDIDPAASYGAAIATAAHDVLVALVAPGRVADLDTAYTATLAAIPDGSSEDEGVAAGDAAAEAMLEARAGDGYLRPFDFSTSGPGPGEWRPGPHCARPRPMGRRPPAVPHPEPGPVPFGRSQPANQQRLREGLQGGQEARLADQHDPHRRSDTRGDLLAVPPPSCGTGWRATSSAAQGLDTVEEARLLAMINLAAADGATPAGTTSTGGTSGARWRPSARPIPTATPRRTPTRRGPRCSTRRLRSGPPLATRRSLITPPATAASAVPSSTRCADFFGTDKIRFDVHSGPLPRPPRHFDRFTTAIEEIVDARVWGGIHFRTADVDGAEIGNKVANWLDQLLPAGRLTASLGSAQTARRDPVRPRRPAR